MAWWDHEELKSKDSRSDRYILAFPNEYTFEEVQAAGKREDILQRLKQTEKALSSNE